MCSRRYGTQLVQFRTNRGTHLVRFGVEKSVRNWYNSLSTAGRNSSCLGLKICRQLVQFPINRGTQLAVFGVENLYATGTIPYQPRDATRHVWGWKSVRNWYNSLSTAVRNSPCMGLTTRYATGTREADPLRRNWHNFLTAGSNSCFPIQPDAKSFTIPVPLNVIITKYAMIFIYLKLYTNL